MDKLGGFRARELVPDVEKWGILADIVEGVDDLMFLGKDMIELMVSRWKEEVFLEELLFILENLRNVSEKDLQTFVDCDRNFIRQHFKYNRKDEVDIDGFRQFRNLVKKKTKILSALKKISEKKPVVPYYRPDDWFRTGDKIKYLATVIKKGADKKFQVFKEFLPATVKQCHFMTVGIYVKGEGHLLARKFEGKIFHEYEAEYLLNNPSFAKMFFKVSDHVIEQAIREEVSFQENEDLAIQEAFEILRDIKEEESER